MLIRYVAGAVAVLKDISGDINAVIDWELAHGNAIKAYGDALGYPVVSLERPVRRAHEGMPRSLRDWEWKTPHYPNSEWLYGFQSTESSHVVCGPGDEANLGTAGEPATAVNRPGSVDSSSRTGCAPADQRAFAIPLQLDDYQPVREKHRLLRIACIVVACLAVPTLVLGLLGFGLGALFSGLEDTYDLLVSSGTMTLVSAALLVLVGLVRRLPCTSKLAIMLTILGMIVAGIPMVFYKLGVPIYGGDFLLYFALAAGMIACGAVGAFLPKPVSTERGFEPIFHRDDR